MLNKINTLLNSVENENLIAINNSALVNGYVIRFNAIIGKEHVENAAEDLYDNFDLEQMTKDLEDQDDQSEVIIKAAKKFAATNPTVGRWTRCGRIIKATDYDLAERFVLEVIEPGVIRVA